MRSMTGFAEKQFHGEGFTLNFRIRSVNSRYLDCQFRLPDFLLSLEQDLMPRLKSQVERGRVTVWLDVHIEDPEKAGMKVNVSVLNPLAHEFEQLQDRYPMLNFTIPLNALFDRDANLLIREPGGDFISGLKTAAIEVFDKLLEQFNEARTREGTFLQQDFEGRLDHISAMLSEIDGQREGFMERQVEIFRERIQQLIPADAIDDGRMIQEAGLAADRLDISEEITRMNAHLGLFRDDIMLQGALGKKLDFILQEMNREINTIGSKSRDEQISRLVVLMKTELEKIREQVQNIE